jgi:HNH endonuclease
MSAWVLVGVVSLAVGLASSLLSTEIKGLLARRARDGVRAAVASLPQHEATLRAEEWEAHLHDLAAEPIRAYLYARQLQRAATQMAREVDRASECAAMQETSLSEPRGALAQRESYCSICAQAFDRPRLERRHIVPFVRGGSATVQNMYLVCAECNRRLHANGRSTT